MDLLTHCFFLLKHEEKNRNSSHLLNVVWGAGMFPWLAGSPIWLFWVFVHKERCNLWLRLTHQGVRPGKENAGQTNVPPWLNTGLHTTLLQFWECITVSHCHMQLHEYIVIYCIFFSLWGGNNFFHKFSSKQHNNEGRNVGGGVVAQQTN